MKTKLIKYKKIEKVTTYVYGVVDTQEGQEPLTGEVEQLAELPEDSETIQIDELQEITTADLRLAIRGK